MKYIKKPIPVEAVQIPVVDTTDAEWFIDAIRDGIIQSAPRRKGVFINTLEGRMYAPWGSYIIRGVDGELYPCRKDIFEKTYEVYEEKGEI